MKAAGARRSTDAVLEAAAYEERTSRKTAKQQRSRARNSVLEHPRGTWLPMTDPSKDTYWWQPSSGATTWVDPAIKAAEEAAAALEERLALETEEREFRAERRRHREEMGIHYEGPPVVIVETDLAPEDRNNRGAVVALLMHDAHAIRFASESLRANLQVMTIAVNRTGKALLHASAHLRGFEDLVLVAVAQDGLALKYADDSLRANKMVAEKAVMRTGCALRFASADLRGDIDVVRLAVETDARALQYASAELRNYRPLVMSAVVRNGRTLGMASEELRADMDLVMIAVRQCGLALQHASAELRRDVDVVAEAVEQNAQSLQYASYDLQNGDPSLWGIPPREARVAAGGKDGMVGMSKPAMGRGSVLARRQKQVGEWQGGSPKGKPGRYNPYDRFDNASDSDDDSVDDYMSPRDA